MLVRVKPYLLAPAFFLSYPKVLKQISGLHTTLSPITKVFPPLPSLLARVLEPLLSVR